jgi:hypothetical protein
MSEPTAAITFTDWATDILGRAQQAARRFDPEARLRLAKTPNGVQAVLVHDPDPDDRALETGGVTVYVESGLQGLVDVEEPHDRLVLRPAGSPPNDRQAH